MTNEQWVSLDKIIMKLMYQVDFDKPKQEFKEEAMHAIEKLLEKK